MRTTSARLSVALAILGFLSPLLAADGNRLAYLDEPCDPYYVHRDFPKLITPQWVGEEGVEAVVTLAIDDMRDPAKYEAYLRPILKRLKQIDGRAPVSIMTCSVKPDDPQLQTWLAEGLSLECHTIDHPCPILAGGDFDKAKSTYDRCVDLMASIPGNKPVAFRTPCCDSQNTTSPRLWAEIINSRTPSGNFLTMDSSVFCILTAKDKSLPREITANEAGEERFRRYLPFKNFVNTIEDYPYPYVIGGLCWEFPCIVPSDWEAQNIQRPNNPDTVRDLKLALDAVVLKQGVFNLVFHPHGWIRPEQVVELIDHAVAKHGKKVKFLTFRECQRRLNENLLAGAALRTQKGQDAGVRLLDVDNDGYMDVVCDKDRQTVTRLWQPMTKSWREIPFPAPVYVGLHFGVVSPAGRAAMIDVGGRMHEFNGKEWKLLTHWRVPGLAEALRKSSSDNLPDLLPKLRDTGVRLRDFDGDGSCELVVGADVLRWQSNKGEWSDGFKLPTSLNLLDETNSNATVRLLDVNGDGKLDFLYSAPGNYMLARFRSMKEGFGSDWVNHPHGDGQLDALPPLIDRDGRNNGCFVHSGELWWQNEHTDRLPNLVEHRSLKSLVTPVAKQEEPKPAANDQAPNDWPLAPIGAARIDITPTHPIRLTGYGARTKESEGVAQKLFAKALAIGGDVEVGTRNAECCGGNGASGEKKIEPDGAAIIITVDNCGVCAPIVDAVRKQLAAKAGIAPERIAICSSHTHAGPMINGFAPMIFSPPPPPEHQKHIDDYTAELTDKLVRVGLFALAARRPGRLSWAVGKVDFAKNRRALQQGKWSGFGEVDEGPVDRRLMVLRASDPDGKLIALLANYACHATTLGGDFNQLHGDWVGVAQERIEAAHPGAIAMISIGTGADANPAPRGKLEHVEQHGKALADEVTHLLTANTPTFKRLDATKLVCKLQTIELPFATLPTQEEYAARAKQAGAPGYHAQHYHDRLARGEKLPQALPYAIATWNFGDDLAMVYLAGEVVVDYSIRLNTVAKSDRLWITAYANDVPCYIASKRVLAEGGYEADSSMIYYARPTRLAPECEDKIIATVKALLPPQYLAVPAADKPSLPDKPAAGQGANADFPPPLSPEDSLAKIHVRTGLKVELVACEPLIADPVAFDWGPDGRLWVVEMRDYPNGLDGKGKAGGRVKVLTDTNADGRYDEAKLFLDDIPFPTGVKVWRSGILVSAAPLIFYAEDTDNDGKADVKKTLYEGFGEGNQQHRVNGLRWGFDGWLYVGNGDSGGNIKSIQTGQVVNVSGRDLRIRPDTGEIETQSGQTQFGRCRDDWGNWFGGNNSNPLWHYVLDDHYLRRNPRLIAPSVRQDVPQVPGASRVYPRSKTLERFNNPNSVNHFTSACSPEIYRDTYLGEEYYGNSFVCEPVHNLIHREIVTPAGFSFTSRRADDEKESEFLASEDNWFRPAMIRTGPDGALWVADMYRFVIEHPQWIPADWQARLNVRAGDDRGRIYRIVRADQKKLPEIPQFDKLDTSQLVAKLDSDNGQVRDMAQQMLVWKGPSEDRTIEQQLVNRFRSAKNPAARIQILSTLETLGLLNGGHLQAAYRDEHPAVQRCAIRLSERYLGRAPHIAPDFLALTKSTDPQVQLQMAYSLGEWDDPRAIAPLVKLLRQKPSSVVLTAAASSSLSKKNIAAVLAHVLESRDSPNDALLERLLAFAAAEGQEEAVYKTIIQIFHQTPEVEPGAGFRAAATFLDLVAAKKITLPKGSEDFFQAVQLRAHATLMGRNPQPVQIAAISMLGRDPKHHQFDLKLLEGLLPPKNSPEMQQAALVALMRMESDAASKAIFTAWPTLGPVQRNFALDVLLSRDFGVKALLDAVEAKQIGAGEFDARRREQLATMKDETLRVRAQKLLNVAPNANRAAVIAQFQPVLTMKGDSEKGMAVFAKRCAQCHRLDGVGQIVGPEFNAINDRSPQALLVALFDPNRAVEDRYRDYSVTLADGRVFSGIIAEETTTSLMLLGPEGKIQNVLRADIESLRATGKSLMPEGLEKDVTPAELADLFAYIARSGPPPKQFEGNSPALVRPAADGSLTLAATTARITGPRMIFETHYKNLGYWSSPDDQAAWTVELPQAGKYRVTLDFACDRTVAGNTLAVQAGDQRLTFRVPSTGTWDDYKQQEIGVLELPAGPSDVVVRAVGEVKGAVLDLKSLRLTPAK